MPPFRTSAEPLPFSAVGFSFPMAGMRGIAALITAGSPASVCKSGRYRGLEHHRVERRIWAPGGIASDGERLIFATGNTQGARRWGDGEAVFRLAPDLARSGRTQDFFAATDWRALDATDTDLGASNPLPLDVAAGQGVQPLVLALGKDGRAYLLDRDDLRRHRRRARRPDRGEQSRPRLAGGVSGGQRGDRRLRGAGRPLPNPRTDDALTALEIRAGAPPSVATRWCGGLTGRSAPIVTTTDGRSDPIVWILGAEGDNRLHGFRGDTGAVLFGGGGPGDQMTGLHHLQTLLATGDRLYVGADGRLYAFGF